MTCGECLMERLDVVELVNGQCPVCAKDYRDAAKALDVAFALNRLQELLRHQRDAHRRTSQDRWCAKEVAKHLYCVRPVGHRGPCRFSEVVVSAP